MLIYVAEPRRDQQWRYAYRCEAAYCLAQSRPMSTPLLAELAAENDGWRIEAGHLDLCPYCANERAKECHA